MKRDILIILAFTIVVIGLVTVLGITFVQWFFGSFDEEPQIIGLTNNYEYSCGSHLLLYQNDAGLQEVKYECVLSEIYTNGSIVVVPDLISNENIYLSFLADGQCDTISTSEFKLSKLRLVRPCG